VRRRLGPGLVLIAMVACRHEAPPAAAAPRKAGPPVTVQTDERNAHVDLTLPLVANAVARCAPEKTAFAKGEPIRLGLTLNESPEKLVVGAKLMDGEKEVAHVSQPARGQKSFTLEIPGKQIAAGKYRLEGYWGGNVVCEHAVEVK
jgi:methionine-rich copper-binding protein CopC